MCLLGPLWSAQQSDYWGRELSNLRWMFEGLQNETRALRESMMVNPFANAAPGGPPHDPSSLQEAIASLTFDLRKRLDVLEQTAGTSKAQQAEREEVKQLFTAMQAELNLLRVDADALMEAERERARTHEWKTRTSEENRVKQAIANKLPGAEPVVADDPGALAAETGGTNGLDATAHVGEESGVADGGEPAGTTSPPVSALHLFGADPQSGWNHLVALVGPFILDTRRQSNWLHAADTVSLLGLQSQNVVRVRSPLPDQPVRPRGEGTHAVACSSPEPLVPNPLPLSALASSRALLCSTLHASWPCTSATSCAVSARRTARWTRYVPCSITQCDSHPRPSSPLPNHARMNTSGVSLFFLLNVCVRQVRLAAAHVLTWQSLEASVARWAEHSGLREMGLSPAHAWALVLEDDVEIHPLALARSAHAPERSASPAHACAAHARSPFALPLVYANGASIEAFVNRGPGVMSQIAHALSHLSLDIGWVTLGGCDPLALKRLGGGSGIQDAHSLAEDLADRFTMARGHMDCAFAYAVRGSLASRLAAVAEERATDGDKGLLLGRELVDLVVELDAKGPAVAFYDWPGCSGGSDAHNGKTRGLFVRARSK